MISNSKFKRLFDVNINGIHTKWDCHEMQSMCPSERITPNPDQHGWISEDKLRHALDRKLCKLRSMISDDSELQNVVNKLVKLALCHVMSGSDTLERNTRWMEYKFFDLLSLSEKAIQRRQKRAIEKAIDLQMTLSSVSSRYDTFHEVRKDNATTDSVNFSSSPMHCFDKTAFSEENREADDLSTCHEYHDCLKGENASNDSIYLLKNIKAIDVVSHDNFPSSPDTFQTSPDDTALTSTDGGIPTSPDEDHQHKWIYGDNDVQYSEEAVQNTIEDDTFINPNEIEIRPRKLTYPKKNTYFKYPCSLNDRNNKHIRKFARNGRKSRLLRCTEEISENIRILNDLVHHKQRSRRFKHSLQCFQHTIVHKRYERLKIRHPKDLMQSTPANLTFEQSNDDKSAVSEETHHYDAQEVYIEEEITKPTENDNDWHTYTMQSAGNYDIYDSVDSGQQADLEYVPVSYRSDATYSDDYCQPSTSTGIRHTTANVQCDAMPFAKTFISYNQPHSYGLNIHKHVSKSNVTVSTQYSGSEYSNNVEKPVSKEVGVCMTENLTAVVTNNNRPKLSSCGVLMHSYKDRMGAEDVVFHGLWQQNIKVSHQVTNVKKPKSLSMTPPRGTKDLSSKETVLPIQAPVAKKLPILQEQKFHKDTSPPKKVDSKFVTRKNVMSSDIKEITTYQVKTTKNRNIARRLSLSNRLNKTAERIPNMDDKTNESINKTEYANATQTSNRSLSLDRNINYIVNHNKVNLDVTDINSSDNDKCYSTNNSTLIEPGISVKTEFNSTNYSPNKAGSSTLETSTNGQTIKSDKENTNEHRTIKRYQKSSSSCSSQSYVTVRNISKTVTSTNSSLNKTISNATKPFTMITSTPKSKKNLLILKSDELCKNNSTRSDKENICSTVTRVKTNNTKFSKSPNKKPDQSHAENSKPESITKNEKGQSCTLLSKADSTGNEKPEDLQVDNGESFINVAELESESTNMAIVNSSHIPNACQVHNIYDRKEQVSEQANFRPSPLAVQTFSGFSMNNEVSVGDQFPYKPLQSSSHNEPGRLIESEEVLLPSPESDSMMSLTTDSDDVLPEWLFQLINSPGTEDIEGQPTLGDILDVGGAGEAEAVGGAGDGRGIHTDASGSTTEESSFVSTDSSHFQLSADLLNLSCIVTAAEVHSASETRRESEIRESSSNDTTIVVRSQRPIVDQLARLNQSSSDGYVENITRFSNVSGFDADESSLDTDNN